MKKLLKKLINQPECFDQMVDYVHDFIIKLHTNNGKPDLWFGIKMLRDKIEHKFEPITDRQFNHIARAASTELVQKRGYSIMNGVNYVFVSKK